MANVDVDVLVIGAGQAGLAMGYYLSQGETSFAIVDQGSEIGEVWRHRYDSLTLFTPRWYSSLPGMSLQGDRNGYATKDEIADYLHTYANAFQLPVHLHTKVFGLEKRFDRFQADTSNETYSAKQVIISTGPFQKPLIPDIAQAFSDDVYQVHTSAYRNPQQLIEGNVLIVGAGNSGAQIAVELTGTRDVTISMGHQPTYLPLELAGKSIFWWFEKLGLLSANRSSMVGRWLRKRPDPIFGLELKAGIERHDIRRKPRTEQVSGRTVEFQDGSRMEVDNVIWATGFYSDFSWIRIPGALHPDGKPVHQQGTSPVDGLFYLGLPWQSRRGSALIGGVGEDARLLSALLGKGKK